MVLSEPLPEDNWQAKNSMEDTGDGFTGFVHQALIDNYLDLKEEFILNGQRNFNKKYNTVKAWDDQLKWC